MTTWNVPAIQLAQRLTELAYPNLSAVYFASGGAEANESAFKTARFYWRTQGRPGKMKILSREYAYHGVTLATMSATAVPDHAKMFEPLHAAMGSRLLAGMQTLRDLRAVGDVRGLGLMVGVELVADRATKAPFDPAQVDRLVEATRGAIAAVLPERA